MWHLPILNCAVWLEREKDIVKDIHIAVGPGGGTPFRATEAEDTLRGQSFNEETFNRTLSLCLARHNSAPAPAVPAQITANILLADFLKTHLRLRGNAQNRINGM